MMIYYKRESKKRKQKKMCLFGWFLPEILRLIPNDENQCKISTFTRSGKEIQDKQINDIRKIFFFNNYYGIPTDKDYFYPTKDKSVVTDDEVQNRFQEVDDLDLKHVLQSYMNLNERYYAFYDTPILIGLCNTCFDNLFLADDCEFSLNELPNNLYHCQDCIEEERNTRVDWEIIKKMNYLILYKYTPRETINPKELFELIHKLESKCLI